MNAKVRNNNRQTNNKKNTNIVTILLKTEYFSALIARIKLYVLCGLFLYPKKFFQFFSNSCNKSHLAVQIWCGKRDKHFSRHNGKGV